ncbi:MAG: hypothetical protein GXO91_10200 [FCB group bacterium]|nr:hypothetical protein [FCB group bacterium]
MTKLYRFLIFTALALQFLAAQIGQMFTGDLHFQYSGALNGDFDAVFVNEDSLQFPTSGAAAGVWTDSTGAHILLPALRPTPGVDQSVDLFLMMMRDDDGVIEPQTWEVYPPDSGDPLSNSAEFFYIPELDSAYIYDLISPVINGEIDSTNIGQYFIDALSGLISEAYIPLTGNISLDTYDDQGMTGTFSGSLMKLAFPPLFLTISGGTYDLVAPLNGLGPAPPQNLTAQLTEGGVQLGWDPMDGGLLSGFNIYRSEDDITYSQLAQVGGSENSYIDFEVSPGSSYFYYVTAVGLNTVESDPSNVVTIEVPGVLLGDLNADGNIDVLDVVLLANIVLGAEATDYELIAGDTNEDGVLDVLDIVLVVNIILGN